MKSALIDLLDEVGEVALFTRAWIEIQKYHAVFTKARVALFTRAWIEILSLRC